MVSVQCLKPDFTADDEAPVEPQCRGRPPHQPPTVPPDSPRHRGRPPRQPPLVPSDPPRGRGRPRKAVTETSAFAPPKRKRVT